MRKFLHVVNPVAVDASSDLFQAQPVTFAALADARRWAEARGMEAHLCAVGYPEDEAAMPAGFQRLPVLTRSVLDFGRFRRERKLPLLSDLIERAVAAADSLGIETIIYTNVDIAPMPDFYPAISALLDQGFDAFTVNRRTLTKEWPGGVRDLPLMRAQIGEPHRGRDCFVFSREAARRYVFGTVCIGAPRVGKILAANMLCHSKNYADFKELHLTFHLGLDRIWLAPELGDYVEHNDRELLAVLGRLRAAGLGSTHPLWTKLVGRLGP